MMSKGSSPTTTKQETEYKEAMKEELCNDVYTFEEMTWEISVDGRLKGAAANNHSKSHEVFLREVCNGNEVVSASSMQEIKLGIEVYMVCTIRSGLRVKALRRWQNF